MVRRYVVRNVSDHRLLPMSHQQDVSTNASHVRLTPGVCSCKYADTEISNQQPTRTRRSRHVDHQSHPFPSTHIPHQQLHSQHLRRTLPQSKFPVQTKLPHRPRTRAQAAIMDSWFSDPDFNAGMPFFDYANDMPSDHMPSDPAPQASMYPASPLEARRMSAFAATNDPELQLDPYQASTVARASGRRPSLPQVPQGPLRFPTGTAYSEVIWNCLKEKPDHRSSLKEIYKYFEKHTDRDHEALRFAALGDKVGFRKERTGWQCSVRHNLSMNEVNLLLSLSSSPSSLVLRSSVQPLTVLRESRAKAAAFGSSSQNATTASSPLRASARTRTSLALHHQLLRARRAHATDVWPLAAVGARPRADMIEDSAIALTIMRWVPPVRLSASFLFQTSQATTSAPSAMILQVISQAPRQLRRTCPIARARPPALSSS